MKTLVKYFTLIMTLVAVLSCGEKEQPIRGLGLDLDGAILAFDKTVIMADGNDEVTFTSYYDGKNVDGQAKIYYRKGNTGNFDNRVGKTFSTSQPGDYEFIVQYKTSKSEVVKISAIKKQFPQALPDPDPSNTSFVHRTFFNQYTGVECPNCPYMVYLLDQTLVDGYEDKVVLAAIRNYSSKEEGFANIPNSGGYYPYLRIDYSTSYDHDGGTKSELQNLIDQWTSVPAMVGISANAKYYEEDGQLIVTASVKAAETGDYNVGLWLMQDKYFMEQSISEKVDYPGALHGTWDNGYDNDPYKNRYDYHDNAVRVAASKYMGGHVGYPLGKIEAGKTAEWTFAVNVNIGTQEYSFTDNWWEGISGGINLDDLHFAVFVTKLVDKKKLTYRVINAIDVPYNGQKSFEYK